MTTHTIFVCIGCGAKEGKKSNGRGIDLLPKLQDALVGDAIDVRAVSCLSNCDRGVSVAMTGSGKFGWLFGEKSESNEDIEALVNAARAYVQTHDGFIAKSVRAKPVIARIPPVDFRQDN